MQSIEIMQLDQNGDVKSARLPALNQPGVGTVPGPDVIIGEFFGLEQLGNGGYEAMLYDLQRYDYSTVNLRQPPKTLALLDQKLQSMEPRLRWWFDKLMQGRLLPGHQAWETEVTRDDLHEDYCRTLQILGTRAGRSTSTELGLRLRELLPKGSPQELQRTIDGERKRLYGLPGLSICRAAFCGFMKHEFSWPQPLEAGDQPDVARL
jgi:hypothetical protein